MSQLLAFFTPDMVGHLAYAAILLILLRLSRPVYLAFRRRRAGYGVVFNSITGIPEPLVSIRLVTPGINGQTVSSAVSDKHGRYRLTARPGEYLVQAVKAGFTFPSRYLKQQSSVYDNILPSAHIIVKEHGMIAKNIPVDPIDGAKRSKAFGFGLHLDKNIQYLLAYGSPVLLYLYPSMRRSAAAWLLFLGYLAVIIHRLFTFKPADPAFGAITDAATHEPVEQAVARIFNAKFNKLLETQVTGPRGRYAFVVQPGSYYLLIKKPGYRSVRINYPAIRKDGYVMAKDVALTRAPERYVDEHPEP
jgi:hypothetical protein